MAKDTAIVFIDGNNFYHNLKKIRVNPNHLDFQKLVKFVCNHFECDLKEVRYYNSKPDIRDGQITYYKHMSFLEELKRIPCFVVKTRKLQSHSTKEVLNEKRELVKSLELCSKCKPIVKSYCEDCIGDFKKKEKGIDVMIAIDMVRKLIIDGETDVCILISGDADFIPALRLIEGSDRKVFSVSVVRGYAYNLRNNFECLVLNRTDLNKNCLKPFPKKKRFGRRKKA